MKIAFLSDVHGNLPALRAALQTAQRQGAAGVVVAGDLVGEGPHPREVVEELRRWEIPAIRGNVDRRVLEMGTKRAKLEKRLRRGTKKQNLAWTALQLLEAAEDRAWLSELPTQRAFLVGGRGVLVVHGSPRGDSDYVYPSLTAEGLRGKLEPVAGERPALLVCGHSHIPFARTVDGVLVVNCGSVGRPADGDPRGSLAVVGFTAAEPTAEVLRFAYPVEQVVAELKARGVPGVDPEEYRQGIKS